MILEAAVYLRNPVRWPCRGLGGGESARVGRAGQSFPWRARRFSSRPSVAPYQLSHWLCQVKPPFLRRHVFAKDRYRLLEASASEGMFSRTLWLMVGTKIASQRTDETTPSYVKPEPRESPNGPGYVLILGPAS